MSLLVRCTAGVLALMFLPLAAHAACKDIAGSADHPLIPRYQGGCILAAIDQSFASTDVPVAGPVKEGAKWTGKKFDTTEGRTTTRLYAIPVGAAPLEVFRNYQQGLADRGFKIDFECIGKACGYGTVLRDFLVLSGGRKKELGQAGGQPARYAFAGGGSQQYLAATGTKGEQLMLFVSSHGGIIKSLAGQTMVYARLIEPAVVEDRLIDAGQMAESIERSGRIALRNIYFDTGKASLKPESDAAFEQIAQLLKSQTGLSLYVVGHTDATGKYQSNLTLSRERAAAVVDALVGRYGVAPARLLAAGVGPLSPAASNRDKAGQAENRRVELGAR